jgi:LPS sulfotransferase NodH
VARVSDHGVRLITLIRANTVAYAISALVARESETWHTYGDEDEQREPVTIDLDRFLRYMTNIENDVRKTRSLVGARGHMALVYERDLAEPDARQATLDRLFSYLDLEPHPLTAATARRRTPYSELVANWNDVERLVKGTLWEPHLEGL